MKACPICQITNCAHLRKFYWFNLAKTIVFQKSLDTAISAFRLMMFIPTNSEMEIKINLLEEDLKKCQIRVHEIRKWIELKVL